MPPDTKLDRAFELPIEVDSQRLLSLCAGKPEVLIECLELLIAEVASNRRQIDQALVSNDMRAMSIGVHSLRGSASLIGATRVRDLAAIIENEVEAGVVRPVAKQWQTLDRELDRCMASVQALLRMLR